MQFDALWFLWLIARFDANDARHRWLANPIKYLFLSVNKDLNVNLFLAQSFQIENLNDNTLNKLYRQLSFYANSYSLLLYEKEQLRFLKMEIVSDE